MPLHIAYGDQAALRTRCEVAAVRTTREDESTYEPGAVIAAGQWRPMTEVDVKSVTAPRRPRDSTLVEIVRLPFEEGAALEDMALPLGDPDAVYLGQGYLAPTEYLLHDGSTEGEDDPSAAAFWLGHWPSGALPSIVQSAAPLTRGL
ncbi:hypothetical protein ACIPW5_08250 [Streptomyces sp. NPDC090077]|uniref:hypothetical protein n=1 Tax=Streptomyces sp. NPDC090077 TaxID=3365938 RepID=UPI0038254469